MTDKEFTGQQHPHSWRRGERDRGIAGIFRLSHKPKPLLVVAGNGIENRWPEGKAYKAMRYINCRRRKAWTCAAAVALALSVGCGNEQSDGNAATWAALHAGGITIDQAPERVGFELILPSYIPPQMETYRFESSELANPPWQPGGSRTDAYVLIGPYRYDKKLPADQITSIDIIEYKRWPGESHVHLPVEETVAIGPTTVTCHLEPNTALWVTPPAGSVRVPGLEITPGPVVNPMYECTWDTSDLHIQVAFSWLLPEPIPGLITSDMRNDALKVVRSMIENPYSP